MSLRCWDWEPAFDGETGVESGLMYLYVITYEDLRIGGILCITVHGVSRLLLVIPRTK